jgi:3-mercaptopyruvate sulfurtransferase SseA
VLIVHILTSAALGAMEYFWAFSWIWIPIIAILAGAFTEWLKFKEKTQQLGSSTKELEDTVRTQAATIETMQGERDDLIRRIQNLEAIVTTEMWDALHDDGLSAAEKDRVLADGRAQLPLPEESSDAERAERLARRLRS